MALVDRDSRAGHGRSTLPPPRGADEADRRDTIILEAVVFDIEAVVFDIQIDPRP